MSRIPEKPPPYCFLVLHWCPTCSAKGSCPATLFPLLSPGCVYLIKHRFNGFVGPFLGFAGVWPQAHFCDYQKEVNLALISWRWSRTGSRFPSPTRNPVTLPLNPPTVQGPKQQSFLSFSLLALYLLMFILPQPSQLKFFLPPKEFAV